MLLKAVREGCWDVMMIGFHVLNQTARRMLLEETMRAGIGTLIMFAVRRALTRRERLRETLDELAERGDLDLGAFRRDDPIGFLEDGSMESIVDASYRFCRHEPGVDCVLTGTGNDDHLRANLDSICAADVEPRVRERLIEVFGEIEGVTAE